MVGIYKKIIIRKWSEWKIKVELIKKERDNKNCSKIGINIKKVWSMKW